MVLIIRTSQLAFKWCPCVLKCYKYSASQCYWHPDDELKRLYKRGKFRKLSTLYSFVQFVLLCKFISIYFYLPCKKYFLLRKCLDYGFTVQCFVSFWACLSSFHCSIIEYISVGFQAWGAGRAVNVSVAVTTYSKYIMSRYHDMKGEPQPPIISASLWPGHKYRWFISSDCFL